MSAAHTYRAALDSATERLRRANVADAAHDAAALVAHAVGRRRVEVLLEERAVLGPETRRQIDELVERRASREPLQHIVGLVGFHDVELAVDRRALVPRPETETLVNAVIAWVERVSLARPRILDLGTGTGAIAIAIANAIAGSRVVASDVSPAALGLARSNVERFAPSGSVGLVVGDWATPFRSIAGFDVVVSNPPYVASAEIPHLAAEVRDHDPHLALDGGSDGLTPYRAICAATLGLLHAPGLLALEIASDREASVVEIVSRAGLEHVEVLSDLEGRPRVVLGTR